MKYYEACGAQASQVIHNPLGPPFPFTCLPFLASLFTCESDTLPPSTGETILDPGTQMQTSHLQVQWSHFGPLLTELRTPQRPQISSGISLTRSEMHSSRALRAFWLQCTQWSSAHSHRCSLSWGDAGKVSGPEEARKEERDDEEARSLQQSCPQACRNLFLRAVE